MSRLYRWRVTTAGLFTAWALVACGGGSGSSTTPAAVTAPASVLPLEPGAPVMLNNVSTDGLNWINFRRAQIGIPVLTRNSVVDIAAQGHSEYQKTNNIVTHDQTEGKPGFTGVKLINRLNAAGYLISSSNSYAYGEVISATTNNSGFYMAEELITAIFHRFVIFEPKFKEIGTGAATTSSGYTYFTSDFTANNGYGPGIGSGNVVMWPANGQTKVTPNFYSDYESPDPVEGINEVGYPISVHADINVALVVQSFTVRPRGGADLSVKLVKAGSASDNRSSAAAIIPLSALKANTTYDVTFAGTTDNVAITKSWSFTTK